MRRILKSAGPASIVIASMALACSWSPKVSELDGLPCQTQDDCIAGYVCDAATKTCIGEADCRDEDGDGYCATNDCLEQEPSCNNDCTDSDIDGVLDCLDGCIDRDGDEFGVGTQCRGEDCNDDAPGCTADCNDVDQDTVPDCADPCVDADGDGVGADGYDTSGCSVSGTFDSNDGDPTACADQDEDGCDDCSENSNREPDAYVADPNEDGTDVDADGVCDLHDECIDSDGDGLGAAGSRLAGCAVADLVDSDDSNRFACGDSDKDGCDDCSQTGAFSPYHDGADDDGDGICALSCSEGSVCEGSDLDDQDPTVCRDLDFDGCDDCSGNSEREPDAYVADPDDDGYDPDEDGICFRSDSNNWDQTACADIDGDDCDDCSSGHWDPANDGEDADRDGFCSSGTGAGDCDDTAPTCHLDNCVDEDNDGLNDCIDGCVDADGDGFGRENIYPSSCSLDCDDRFSFCNANCDSSDIDPTTLGDIEIPATPDCVEQACGSDPRESDSFCLLADGETLSFTDALKAAKDSAGFEHILIGYVLPTRKWPLDNDRADRCVELRSAVQLRAPLFDTLFDVNGDGCRLVGLNVVGGERTIDVRGDSALIEDCTLDGWSTSAIVLSGTDGTRIEGCTLTGGRRYGAAVVSSGSDNILIVRNVIAENEHDGINVSSAIGVTIDHNTIANNGNDAIAVDSGTRGLCLRNNAVFGNLSTALQGSSAEWLQACCPQQSDCGNAHGGNGAVGTVDTSDGVNVWHLQDVSAQMEANYCLAAASPLIDAGIFIDGSGHLYDLNGSLPGHFNGSGPDIGAREVGSPRCD